MALLWGLSENGEKYKIRIEEPHKIAFIYWQRGEKATKHHPDVPLFQCLSTSPFSSLRTAVLPLHNVTGYCHTFYFNHDINNGVRKTHICQSYKRQLKLCGFLPTLLCHNFLWLWGWRWRIQPSGGFSGEVLVFTECFLCARPGGKWSHSSPHRFSSSPVE